VPASRRALDQVYSAAYEELRRLANRVRRGSPYVALSPTTLVHEAWVKLAATPGLAATDPLHFKRIAARAMRQVLIDAARRSAARKRGGPGALVTTLSDANAPVSCTPRDVIALDLALDELARCDPDQALIVECRFFGGLELHEIATMLGVSEMTVSRHWRATRAWLAAALRRAEAR